MNQLKKFIVKGILSLCFISVISLTITHSPIAILNPSVPVEQSSSAELPDISCPCADDSHDDDLDRGPT